jgi:hypothetical protein
MAHPFYHCVLPQLCQQALIGGDGRYVFIAKVIHVMALRCERVPGTRSHCRRPVGHLHVLFARDKSIPVPFSEPE